MKGEFVGDFTCISDLMERFNIVPSDLDGCLVMLAWYGYGSYCGHAYVLFSKAGKLFDVEGSHCSCDGLVGQWDPVETCVEKLRRDLSTKSSLEDDSGYTGSRKARDVLAGIVIGLESREK